MTTEEFKKSKKIEHDPAIHPLLSGRFSPRVFSDQKLSDDEVAALFEAARWTPSSYNRQPWHFIYAVKGTEGFEQLTSCLVESNIWAKDAPLLILGCAIKEDEQGPNPYATYDLGQSVMSLVVQATSMNLAVHQMGGFDRDKAKETLKLEDNLKPHVMIAVGYIGDYATAPETLVQRDRHPRHRRENIARQM